MKVLKTVFLFVVFLLTGCVTQMNSVWSSIESTSKHRIQFTFPEEGQWVVAGQEHDAGGYSRSWKPVTAQGAAPEQSLYINFGRGIKTSLSDSMQQVKSAMQAEGCADVRLHVWARATDFLTFTAAAGHCSNGRSVWQIFRVANRADGQYSVVYSANPDTVPVAARQQMAQAVEMSKVIDVRPAKELQ